MKFFDSLLGKKTARPEDGNPTLLRAMNEVALNDHPDNRQRLYQALLTSMLFVPVPQLPEGLNPGLQVARAPIKIQLTTMLDPGNRRVTPAFTDEPALRNWDPNTPYMGLKAQDLFKFCVETNVDEVAINPFDPIRKMIRPGGRVTRREFEALSNGVVPTPPAGTARLDLRPGQEIAIGKPAKKLRVEVEEALSTLARSMPEVDELYVFQMATRQGQSWLSHTVIGVQAVASLSDAEANEVTRNFANSMQPNLDAGQSLDFLALTGAFGKQIRTTMDQIFTR